MHFLAAHDDTAISWSSCSAGTDSILYGDAQQSTQSAIQKPKLFGSHIMSLYFTQMLMLVKDGALMTTQIFYGLSWFLTLFVHAMGNCALVLNSEWNYWAQEESWQILASHRYSQTTWGESYPCIRKNTSTVINQHMIYSSLTTAQIRVHMLLML